jgi:hypothetical protein
MRGEIIKRKSYFIKYGIVNEEKTEEIEEGY